MLIIAVNFVGTNNDLGTADLLLIMIYKMIIFTVK